MAAKPGTRRMLRFMIKAMLTVFAVMVVAAIVILKWMERSPAQLKVGFESYLTELSGYPADIGSLRNISFLPHMAVDMTDVRMWALEDPGRTMIGVKRAAVRMPLWSVMLGTPRFSLLEIDGVLIDEEVSGIAPIILDRLDIDKETGELTAEGAIGGLSVAARVPLEASGATFKPKAPPVRIVAEVKGANTRGTVFIDINSGGYGATADFARYAAADMRPAQLLLQRWLADRGAGGALPVSLRIERLEGAEGPFAVPALKFLDGALQPPECFYSNQGRAGAVPHPCAVYFEEPDTDDKS